MMEAVFSLVLSLGLVFGIVFGVLGIARKAWSDGGSSRRRLDSRGDGATLTTGRKILVGVAAALVLAGPIHFAAWGVYGYFVVEPEFKREVHGHTLNAYYANTPELMLQELHAAKQGMVDLGLEPHQYSTLVPWKQTPDNRMDYQFQIMDSVIQRVEAVKADRERQEQQGGSDQLGDVYETKMDNLRGFLLEDGWIDDIAQGAFAIEKHPYYAWWANWGAWTAIPWLGALALGAGAIFLPQRKERGVLA